MLLSIIGEGGMGRVYRAFDPNLGREVALKAISEQFVSGPERRSRLLREARAMARLHHPGIVEVYEVGEEEGSPYFTMRLVEGPTLFSAIERGPMSVVAAARIIEAIARILGFAHDQGFIHRDVKPNNILLDPRRGPVLLDFGLVRDAGDPGERPTAESQLMGTPTYMAPEVALGGPRAASSASDQYALGVVFAELLLGRHPFPAPTPFLSLQRALKEPMPSLAALGLPEALDRIAARATARDPAERYPHIARMADELASFLSSAEIGAGPLPAVDRPQSERLGHARTPTLVTDERPEFLASPRPSLRWAAVPLLAFFLGALALRTWGGGDAASRDRAELMRSRVGALTSRGDWEAAETGFHAYLANEPDGESAPVAESLVWWAERLREAGRTGEARDAYGRAYGHLDQLEPESVMVPLAELHHEMGALEGLQATIHAMEVRAPELLERPAMRALHARVAAMEGDFSAVGAAEIAALRGLSRALGPATRLPYTASLALKLHQGSALGLWEARDRRLRIVDATRPDLPALADLTLPAAGELLALPSADGRPEELLLSAAGECRLFTLEAANLALTHRWACETVFDALREPGRGDGAILLAESRVLRRVVPGPGGTVKLENPYPSTDAANSELLDLLQADMDEDGREELWVGTSGWGAYDLRVIDPAGGAVELRDREKLGRVVRLAEGNFRGERAVAALQSANPNVLRDVRSFGPKLPHGEPAGVYLFGLGAQGLERKGFLPLPAVFHVRHVRQVMNTVDRDNLLFAADLDGDGRDELVQELGPGWTRVLTFDAEGRPDSLDLQGAYPLETLEVDGDAARELLIRSGEALWVLGAGADKLPQQAPWTLPTRVPELADGHAFRALGGLAEDLGAMHLFEAAAVRLEELAELVAGTDAEVALELRAAEYWEHIGAHNRKNLIYRRLAGRPLMSPAAQEHVFRALLADGLSSTAIEVGRRRAEAPDPPAWLLAELGKLEGQVGPSLAFDFTSGIPEILELTDAVGLLNDPSAAGLRHRVAGRASPWRVPLRVGGDSFGVTMELSVPSTDWGTYWDLSLEGTGISTGFTTWGGGGVLMQRQLCGPRGWGDDFGDRDSLRQRVTMSLEVDRASGLLRCSIRRGVEDLAHRQVQLERVPGPGEAVTLSLRMLGEGVVASELVAHRVELRGLTSDPSAPRRDGLRRALVAGDIGGAMARLESGDAAEPLSLLERFVLMDAADRPEDRDQVLAEMLWQDPGASGVLGRALIQLPDRVMAPLRRLIGERSWILLISAHDVSSLMHADRATLAPLLNAGTEEVLHLDPRSAADPADRLGLLRVLGRAGATWRRVGRPVQAEAALRRAVEDPGALSLGDEALEREARTERALAYRELALLRLAAGDADGSIDALLRGADAALAPELFADQVALSGDYAALKRHSRWQEIERIRRQGR